MKATKYTMSLRVDVLSLDSIPALLVEASARIADEFTTGELVADDGDRIAWSIESKPVDF